MPDEPTLRDHLRRASLARPLRAYTCQLPECGCEFTAQDPRARFCSQSCRQKAAWRRKRAKEGAGAGS